jgi:hypothetical protein
MSQGLPDGYVLHQVINSGHTAHTVANDSGPNGHTTNGIVTDWPLPDSTNDDETSSKFEARRSCLPRKVTTLADVANAQVHRL